MSSIEIQEKCHEDVMTSPNRARAHALSRHRSISMIVSVAVAAVGFVFAASAAAGERTFASPEKATAALAAAWQSDQTDELLAIFGPEGKKLVRSGDPVAERLASKRLVSAYAEGHHLETENARKVVIVLGKDEWPYPIPLVRRQAGWTFDVKAGEEEIIDRRVGRNEMNAIKVCHAYVEAQRDYANRDPLGNGEHEYAQRVASSERQHDGLYWRLSGNDKESPLGPLVATAEVQGYGAASAAGRAPFHGYYYRILTRQGRNVSGGTRDYVINGHLTGGFALIAFPAKYGDSGVMTFIVNQNGIVFKKNLGPNTSSVARRVTQYDPDLTWDIVKP